MTSLGIIGGGVLGKACARGFIEHCDVNVFDVVEERSTVRGLGEAATCDVVMICLPTPPLPDGRCDTSHIEDFLRTAAHERWWTKDSCYVIRSTVPVGFTEGIFCQFLRSRPLFHSPEFLTARCAMTDFQIPARNIIGRPGISISDESCVPVAEANKRLCDLYSARFPGVPLLTMPSNASELVKLACNSFFAAKVSLFNLFNEIARAAEVDWHDVLDGIMSDGRIAHAHTGVGTGAPDKQRGFGGTCLPKDTASLFHCAQQAGIDAELLRAVLDRNEAIRRPFDPLLVKIELPGQGTANAAAV